MEIEQMAIAEQAKLISASLDSCQDRFADITAAAFMKYQAEANDYVEKNRGKVPDEVLGRTVQELLVKKIGEAASATFRLGYTAGMQAAFDIVEAKAMELGGGPCSAVN
jgi:hypothetical protein